MASRSPDRKVAINEFAVIHMALRGLKQQVDLLLIETRKTLVRLKLNPKRIKAAAFIRTPRKGVGTYSLSGTKSWLEDIQNTPQYADDIEFLKKLHNTLRTRKT